jgi:hypothetical protein
MRDEDVTQLRKQEMLMEILCGNLSKGRRSMRCDVDIKTNTVRYIRKVTSEIKHNDGRLPKQTSPLCVHLRRIAKITYKQTTKPHYDPGVLKVTIKIL